jgi:hypothetical protein
LKAATKRLIKALLAEGCLAGTPNWEVTTCCTSRADYHLRSLFLRIFCSVKDLLDTSNLLESKEQPFEETRSAGYLDDGDL